MRTMAMGFWSRWLGRENSGGRLVRIILHPERLPFVGFDYISMLDRPITEPSKLPFQDSITRETVEPYDAKRHFTMNGEVPDTIHRFIRANGWPLDVFIKDGRIIAITDNAGAYKNP